MTSRSTAPWRKGIALPALLFLLGAASLPAQDSTFLLTADAPTYRHPAYVGNGRMSLVTSPRATDPALSFLAGTYEHAAGDVPRVAALPAWNEIDVFDGARWLNTAPAADTALRRYRQTVNMYDGSVHTSYEWADGERRTSIEVQSFVSRSDPDLAAIRLEIVPHYAGRVRVAFTLRPWKPPHRLPLERLERLPPGVENAQLWYPGHMVVRRRGAERLDATGGRLWMTATPEGRTTTVAEAAAAIWPPDLPNATVRTTATDTLASIEVAFDAVAEARYTFHKLVSIVSSKEAPAPLTRARAAAHGARARGYEALYRAHAAAWRALWETDIVIEGDPELQRAVRAMLFYLLGSARAGSVWSIPPMGLSSAGYYGHVFWDADTWMFPALVLTHPEIARSLVMYRARTLEAARRNARANGFRGAMYPWEAGEFGEETTPRFAGQNASSEIHVTGDVALAQWQYYLVTGDSAWLARYGYPVIRETADFWLSRVSFDTARGRYDIRNVVSVDEGLIGVANDAYTNAVARRNLEIATAASRRLGREPNPRWSAVAAKLVIPFDSAARAHATYEDAPPETLGSVVPLLAYPLGIPMRVPVKRTDLEHAVRRLRGEGAGAMMTSTLYPVVAAELRDRALLDTLVSGTWRPYLRGPFRILAETPRNDAVNFVTGAGGFLQQVLYGYTGLRITDDGVVPKFEPLLPSHVRRLVLRNVHLRGGRYDVIVEGDSLRTVARAPQRAEEGAPAARVRPVLAFPDPALDDTAAYQGYRTRFFRDSKGNAVQVYLDGRSGRVVQLWADAADESVGFTIRDGAGRPAGLTWGSDDAVVADSGTTRTITYRLTATAPRIDIGWLLLGSMRVERDFQYARHHLEPFTAPPFQQQELVALIENVRRLPPMEQRRALALLNARSIGDLRARLRPTITHRDADTACVVRVVQPTFDGRNHLALELRTDPRQATMRVAGSVITARARSAAPIGVTITVVTDAAPLTPLDRDEIFNRDFLDFLAAVRAAHDSVRRLVDPAVATGADSAVLARYRWLEREVRSVELLSTGEKLMAGMPNFATYFGRDMMMSALMMEPIWTETMAEHVIASVLRKLSPRGDVSHEEALGGQAIRENASEYNALITSYLRLAREGHRARAESVLVRARTVLADLQAVRENYHMMDDELQLPVLAARYLDDPDVTPERKRAFLLDTTSHHGTPRLALLLRELALVASETAPYAREPAAQHLIAFPKLDSTHWRSASWRDSQAGYANGRFAMDINVIWAPRALESIARILTVLRELGFTERMLDSLAPAALRPPLREYLRNPDAARQAARTWRGAARYFTVTLAPSEIRERVHAKLAWLPDEERRYWERIVATAGAARDSLTFLALALDSAGRPIPVLNTDPATRLFLDGNTADVLHDSLGAEQAMRQLDAFVRPYPVGLFVDGLGPLVANDTYAPPAVWEAFRKDPYHSPRVVWGREVNLLLLGLARQLETIGGGDGRVESPTAARYARALEDVLDRIERAVGTSGFKHAELWSYRMDDGRLVPIRYGTSSDIQLWSSTDLAVQFMLSRLPRD